MSDLDRIPTPLDEARGLLWWHEWADGGVRCPQCRGLRPDVADVMPRALREVGDEPGHAHDCRWARLINAPRRTEE